MKKTFSQKFLSPDNFNEYTYSKKKHFDLFLSKSYDEVLFRRIVDPAYCDLKVYQDLFIFTFLKNNVSKGSRILEIGGGDSRILNHFTNDYECWNVDKLEGIGNGPTEIDTTGFRMVHDYMGNLSEELPDDFFDVVFSISTLKHIPFNDLVTYENILKDINRVLKPGGYSIHCVDLTAHVLPGGTDEDSVNPIIPYLFGNQKMLNDFIPIEAIESDPGLFFTPEKYYKDNREETTGKTYKEFGRPFSYNFLWKK